MSNDGQSHSGRFSDCQKAILPLVISALRASPTGICDAETVLGEILPKAEADGWQKDEVISVLRFIGRATCDRSREIRVPVPPSDR
jgi:hypothetical protein